MMRVGIIGCGKQADAHAAQIQRISGCEIVGVCDTEPLLAKQLAERYAISEHFGSVEDLLHIAKPEVVHIITPPQSHFPLGKLCLEAGCHVMVEKPFTLDFREAEVLVDIAATRKLKLTVGHHHQFSDVAIQMRELIRDGFLGSEPVHIESMFGYDFTDERYAKALLGDRAHWVRRLPGKLLHNILSHPVSKIAEFIKDDRPRVIAHGFTSRFLEKINEHEIIDELRVIVLDGTSNTTAYLTFSSQINPIQHQLRLYGLKNSLILDYATETLMQIRKTNYKSYLNHIVPPFLYGKQFLAQSAGNLKRFVARTLNFESGRRRLIESFYNSIRDWTAEPISYKQILLTSWIMDEIFRQLNEKP